MFAERPRSNLRFIERHIHGKPFRYLHPKIEKLLGDTYGVMLFQEDVMRIAVEVAGYTVADADRFRSEVSKKVSAARVQAQYVDFVHRRAQQAGIERKTAEAIWDEVLRFAAYSYCKAHATVYANIAWQTAWMKAHYPREFYCSLLNNHQGMYPLRVYAWDAKRHGIAVLPPHVNHSGIEWSLQNGAIRGGTEPCKGAERRHRAGHPRAKTGPEVPRPGGFAKAREIPQARVEEPHSCRSLRGPGIHPAGDAERAAACRPGTGTADAFRYLPGPLRRDTARLRWDRVMGFVTLEDATGLAEISFFPDKLPLYKTICSYGGPVWATGKVTEHLSSISVDCSDCGRIA